MPNPVFVFKKYCSFLFVPIKIVSKLFCSLGFKLSPDGFLSFGS